MKREGHNDLEMEKFSSLTQNMTFAWILTIVSRERQIYYSVSRSEAMDLMTFYGK